MRTALVTGASGGLGICVARELAGRGFRLILQYRSREDAVQELAAHCRDALTVRADIAVDDGIEALRAAVLGAVGTGGALHAMVNAAGATDEALLPRTTEDHWDAMMDVNLHGPVRLFRTLLPFLVEGRGHALFVLSHAGRHGRQGLAAYAAAKAALEGFVIAASRELGPRRVRVNGVTPGFMLTAMGRQASQQSRDRALREHPLARHADPAEVAAFVGQLIGMESVTGQVFPLEGRVA